MDPSSHLAAAAGLLAGATLSEATEPLVKTIGGWATLGAAGMCALEAMRTDPRWDHAIGYGTAGGAVTGSLILLRDILASW
jgi:hypothetical protein